MEIRCTHAWCWASPTAFGMSSSHSVDMPQSVTRIVDQAGHCWLSDRWHSARYGHRLRRKCVRNQRRRQPTHRPAQSMPISRGARRPRDPYSNGMMRSRATHPTPRARVASGVARDGVPLSRRDETSFPRVRSIARIPRLGIAAVPLSWICRDVGLPAVPGAQRRSRRVRTRSHDV